MGKLVIDINCDVGEGIGNEKDLLPLISSCNIACGGHAGSYETMSEVLQLAKIHNVKVGVHPSYPDPENFGRISMDIGKETLLASIQEQIENFSAVLKEENMVLHHIKPHGALYNDIAKNNSLANIFLEAIAGYKSDVLLYVPYQSAIARIAVQHGFKIRFEAFADRNYNVDLSLVSRKLPTALIQKPEKVLVHLVRMVKEQKIRTPEGKEIGIEAQTYCIHGDTPKALEIINYLTEELPKNNIQISK